MLRKATPHAKAYLRLRCDTRCDRVVHVRLLACCLANCEFPRSRRGILQNTSYNPIARVQLWEAMVAVLRCVLRAYFTHGVKLEMDLLDYAAAVFGNLADRRPRRDQDDHGGLELHRSGAWQPTTSRLEEHAASIDCQTMLSCVTHCQRPPARPDKHAHARQVARRQQITQRTPMLAGSQGDKDSHPRH